MDANFPFPFPFSAVPASGPGRIAVPCDLGDAGGGGGRASHRPGARPRPRSRPAQRPHPRSARTAPAAAACAMERRVAREFRHKVRRRGRPGPPPRPERRLRAAGRPWPGTAPPAGHGCAPVSREARREKLGDFALPCRRRGWQPPGTGWVLKTLERERRGSLRSARALSGLGTVCFVFSAPLEPVPESRRWRCPLSPARTRRGSARSGSTLTLPGAVVQRRLIHAAARAAWHFVVLPFIRLNKCSAERKIV